MRKDNRRKILFVLIGVILFLFSSGWADGKDNVLVLGTVPAGTNVNAIATGLATVLNNHLPVAVKIMPTTGPVEWLPMVTTGEVDMGVLTLWDAKMGRLGKAEYKVGSAGKGTPIYLLCSGTINLTGMLVAESSGIKKGADLKGKRCVCIYTGSGGVTGQGLAFLANYGLKTSSGWDVKMMSSTSVDAGVRLVGEGRADAVACAMGMPVITEINVEKGVHRFLSLDPSPEAVKRMEAYFPAPLVQATPGRGKVGVTEPVYMMAVSFYLVGSEKLSDDLAYAMVKALWEYNEELFPINPRLREWTKDKFADRGAWIPYHPGVIKFYKEKAVWGAEMDNLQRRLLQEK